ncbi:helix-turn-helix domain-containing protein [Allokutzneria sp. A3M-2-11 16]|uniref:helix-turn-helix domain-containing protein n=1 Tax=Allokutzneria sp. A3M-2-11 16 TaxID=2962043 RepID=UPI0020B88918|nr:helix-turn-helix domain-containing protein [Allokutzneria sp. A3M-2-11 16]MCP3805422.1 helix-turn-helix domain-containing protein [Allokutzneria sp. A3M-2-11 16]
MRGSEADWSRVADEARSRREARGWSQLEVAARGSIGLDTVQAIEAARRVSYRGRTLDGLERGLDWRPGSIEAILRGGKPTGTEQDLNVDEAAPDDELTRLLRVKYRQLVGLLGPELGAETFERWYMELGRRMRELETEETSTDNSAK